MDDGSPIHGHTGLEIVWTLIPTILVVGIAVYSGVALAQSEDLPPDHRTVQVHSEQFAWTFTYPDIEVEGGKPLTTGELVLPIDQTVRVRDHLEGRHPLVLGAPVADEAGRGPGHHDAARP